MTAESGAALLLQAWRRGITFWDTADDYGSHPHVARALEQIPREQVIVASKKTTAQGSVERILDELGTSYLDVLFLHDVALAEVDAARDELLELRKEKETGRVRALGLSTHSAAVARLAVEWPEVEALMLPLNRTGLCTDFYIEDGGIQEMLVAGQEAAAAGKGVVAMKVYACGAFAGEGQGALSFAAGLPFVHSLCIGIRKIEEIELNVKWLEEIEFRATTPGGGTR